MKIKIKGHVTRLYSDAFVIDKIIIHPDSEIIQKSDGGHYRNVIYNELCGHHISQHDIIEIYMDTRGFIHKDPPYNSPQKYGDYNLDAWNGVIYGKTTVHKFVINGDVKFQL